MDTPLTLALSNEDLVALDRLISARGEGLSREIVALQILRAGLRGSGEAQPDEGLRPEELNASNDS